MKYQDPAVQEGQPVLQRVFEAPRELVWRAWTDPRQFVQWWRPGGPAAAALDTPTGDHLRVRVKTEALGDLWAGGVLYEVDPPSRLVFGDYLADEHGNRVAETVTSVFFEDLGDGRTRLTLR